MTEPIFNERGERVLAVVPNTLAVYRNLRIGLGLTALMLGASIIIQSTYVMHRDADKLCWQGALSEYFYTSAHNVFVAGLVGLATMLFIYRGTTDTENALLQLAAIGALTAALVPQGYGYIKQCIPPPPMTIPNDVAVLAAIRSNLWAVVAALAVAWLITRFHRHYNTTTSSGGKWARGLLWVVVVVGLIALCTTQFDSRDIAHGVAGLLLLSSFIVTVFVTAHLANREVPERSRHGEKGQCFYKCFYRVWSIVMVLTFVGILVVHFARPDFLGPLWVTCLEGAVLLEFCVYWVVQTFDLWDDPDRRYRLSDDDQDRLAQTYEQISEDDEKLGDRIMAFL